MTLQNPLQVSPPTRFEGSWSQSSTRIVIAILLTALLAIAGYNILEVFNPDNFHEELRILAHHDPARTNEKDYAGQFLSAFPQPFLYVILTKAALGAGIDLVVFHKVLSAVCGILLLAGGAAAGMRVGGPVAAAAVAVLIAAQPIYQYQINSATPHAFAFPLLMWGLVFLLYRRPYALTGVAVLSGLLYPAISPVLGLCLAWDMVVARKGLTARNQNRIADLLVLGLTGVVLILLLWHQLTPVEGYGAPLAPGAKADLYPENSPDGRHFYGVFHPFAYVLHSTILQFRQELPLAIITILPLCFVGIAGYGFFRLRRRPEIIRPLLSFVIPSLVFCSLIVALRPYLAYRFVLYPLFTVLPLLFTCGLLMLCDAWRARPNFPEVATVAVISLFVISLNSVDSDRNGFSMRLDASANRLMEFVRGLPPDSLLANWPGSPQTDLIPYVTGRPLLVNFKAHYPTYERHILNMRVRMFDLIDAYLAKDIDPLVRLRCRWQVDYLVVDRDHFAGKETEPKYFEPFNERVEDILQTTEKSKMLLRQPPASAIAFQSGRFILVDLAQLIDGAGCPSKHTD